MTDAPLYGLPRTEEAIAADPQPGDIYRTSWGYDQTNVEFFEVVKRTASTVTLRRIAAKMGDPDHGENPHSVYPAPGRYIRDRLIEGNPTIFDSATRSYRPNPVFEAGERTGYTEKRCRLKKSTPGCSKYGLPGYSLKISDVRRAYPYSTGGAYDTLAAGEAGH